MKQTDEKAKDGDLNEVISLKAETSKDTEDRSIIINNIKEGDILEPNQPIE